MLKKGYPLQYHALQLGIHWNPSISPHAYGCLQYSSHLSYRGSSLGSKQLYNADLLEPAIRYGQVRDCQGV